MPDFPFGGGGGGGLIQNIGAVTADSKGLTVTSGAANVKGAWGTLTSAALFECTGLHLYKVQNSWTNGNGYDALVDIGVGSTPVVKIADIPYAQTDQINYPGEHYYFPISIREGEEISVRLAAGIASSTMDFIAILESRGFKDSPGFSLSRTYGAVSADSGGTQCDPGATINVKGGMTPITTSSEFHISQLCVFAHVSNANAGLTAGNWLMDIAVGASSSEKVIISNIGMVSSGTPDAMSPIFLGCFSGLNIPPGTRISVDLQCSQNGSVDRLLDVILIGFG